MRIAAVQNHPALGATENNILAAHKLIDGIDADMFVFPELCFSGYALYSPGALEAVAESDSGQSINALKTMAKAKDALIIAGFPHKTGKKIFNAAAIVSPEGLLGIYHKIHLFYRENEVFNPGETAFEVFTWKSFLIGVMVCFDWIFPESCRSLALQGAHIIAHPSNLVLPYCQQSMATRSLENHVYTVTANRVGTEFAGKEKLTFTGSSIMYNHKGEVLQKAAPDKEEVLVSDVDLNLAGIKDLNAYNHLFQDRKRALYTL